MQTTSQDAKFPDMILAKAIIMRRDALAEHNEGLANFLESVIMSLRYQADVIRKKADENAIKDERINELQNELAIRPKPTDWSDAEYTTMETDS